MFRIAIALIAVVVLPAAQAQKREVSSLRNADPLYQELRTATLDASYAVAGLKIERDVAEIELTRGTVTFAKAVNERRLLAVFQGAGVFRLTTDLPWEQNNLRTQMGEDHVEEAFAEAVFWFSDDTYAEIAGGSAAGAVPAGASNLLEKFRNRMRRNPESRKSTAQFLLSGADMDNVEADLLAALYNPSRKPFFNAAIYGKEYDELRFHLRPTGAIPGVNSPEEVGLVHLNPGSDHDGIWYLAHYREEYGNGGASSLEDNRIADAKHFRIKTDIATGKRLSAECDFTLTPLHAGERVLKLSLLPDLRVTTVTDPGGEPMAYIQEDLRDDPALYVVLPQATEAGKDLTLHLEYDGDEVVESAGGGNFYISARTSWYPSTGGFKDRATYDLTFEHPKRYTLASVGQLISEEKGKKTTVSNWKSDIPLTVAGFNYGDFTKMTVRDEPTSYDIEGYATSKTPDFLQNRFAELPRQGVSQTRGLSAAQMSPRRMMENAVAEAQMSIRLFTKFYGELPFGRVAITQQPQFGFGQSWPSLVYLPVSAFLDSTQRWALLGSSTFGFSEFIQEVTPHEVAHQWWGHAVGWATYHDQWISEGFADFSAALYLQATNKDSSKYLKHVENWREAILEKNNYGNSANDAGPLWMGSRLSSAKNAGAYRKLIYPKGGYVLHMLRWAMYTPQDGDKAFIEAMHDFVKTHYNADASTETLQAVMERHIPQHMNLTGDGKLTWFFGEWVYGTEIPSYQLDYSLKPEGQGATLEATITQSGVADTFLMPVGIYIVVDGQPRRLGTIGMAGSSTSEKISVPLPMMPEAVTINAFRDILADKVVINRAN